MKITLLVSLGAAGVVGCIHEMPHQDLHHESAAQVDHHRGAGESAFDHHDVPAHHVVGAVEAEGSSSDNAISHLQRRATAIGADRVIDVVTEPIGAGRFRARGRAVRTTH